MIFISLIRSPHFTLALCQRRLKRFFRNCVLYIKAVVKYLKIAGCQRSSEIPLDGQWRALRLSMISEMQPKVSLTAGLAQSVGHLTPER